MRVGPICIQAVWMVCDGMMSDGSHSCDCSATGAKWGAGEDVEGSWGVVTSCISYQLRSAAGVWGLWQKMPSQKCNVAKYFHTSWDLQCK